jgi:ABC-type branched-subunit amino acid transport system ATPase component
LNRPTSGHVYVDGEDVTRNSATARAQRGLGRTFQQMELFDSLTVRQNVSLGAEAGLAGWNPLRHVVPRRLDGKRVRLSVQQALGAAHLTGLADVPVGGLSTGQRRLVEVGRCLAGDYRLLLLDEPSSGLDHTETEQFGEILKQVVQERGIGILIVEHDMALVNQVCEEIYVMDFGRLIFSGPPQEVMSSEMVQAAYLGSVDEEAAAPTDSAEEESVR